MWLHKQAPDGLAAWVFVIGLLGVGLLGVVRPAAAQAVTLAGMLGGKALVIVDGSTPKAVAVGETHKGVRLLATQGDNATLTLPGRNSACAWGTRLPAWVEQGAVCPLATELS